MHLTHDTGTMSMMMSVNCFGGQGASRKEMFFFTNLNVKKLVKEMERLRVSDVIAAS